MRRLARVCASLACIVAAAAYGATAANPRAPGEYLDHALALMRANAIVTPAKGWPTVTREARKMAARARRPADAYGAIIFALDQLRQAGDVHEGFTNPLTAKLEAQAAKRAGTVPTPPPAVSLAHGRLGLVEVPAIASLPSTPNARRYVSSALSNISVLQTQSDPCGWIIDLRENTGGDMYPMLLGVGPLLGDGPLIGFTGRKGFRYYVSYRDGALSGGGYTDRAPVVVPAFSPAPPVAVLTGPTTASSGEAVTVAFRGRANTRSFGAATGGVTTAPQTYHLVDGAEISFSVSDYVDHNGVIYDHAIAPDAPVAQNLPDSAAEQAAEQWLLSTPQCSQHS
ncbi:MAG: S41 family peptidase [Gaiellaceae bacterium]